VIDVSSQVFFEWLIITIFTAGAAFGALWAAWETRKTAIKTHETVEGQMLNDFLKDYSSNKMLKSLQTLREWKKEHRDDFKEVFEELYKRHDKEAEELNIARRTVAHHFMNALTLYNRKYASRRFIETICQSSGIEIMFEVAEPLHEVVAHVDVGQPYEKEIYDQLREISGYRSS